MTLTAILADVYRRLGFAASPDASVSTRITSFVNTIQRQILVLPGLESLRDDTVSFASVANQAVYGLPASVARIEGISERTNNRVLTRQSLAWVRDVDPGLQSTGVPVAYLPRGPQAVAIQPADASELFVKSSDNATDTGATKKAYVEGFTTGGAARSASVALTGTTAVSLGATITSWIEVTKFYLDFTPVGIITLTEDSGIGTELARLGIGQAFARYQGVQLWPTPTAAVTYYVDYVRTVPDLVNGTDEPLVPEEFQWLIATGARMLEYEKQDQQRYLLAKRELDDGIKHLRFHVASWAVGSPNLRGRQACRPSRLGGLYPAGS